MKISAISDLHGYLPEIEPCDILIIAGDICPIECHKKSFQYRWVTNEFQQWVSGLPTKYVVVIAGNHDFVFEPCGQDYLNIQRILTDPNRTWHYLDGLEEKCLEIMGVKIYGCPWITPVNQNNIGRWAFEKTERDLEKLYSLIPSDVDILISHGPPEGYGDKLWWNDMHIGSHMLEEFVDELKPRIVLCGHCHEAYGSYNRYNITSIYNVSLLDQDYNVKNKPTVLEI